MDIKTSNTGIIYLAFGKPYLAMAMVSYRSAVRTNPSLPVCILTNVSENPPDGVKWRDGFDRWVFLDMDTALNRHVKTQLHKYTPFEKTLYLDCDTEILGDISAVSMMLDHFDICFKLNAKRQLAEKGGSAQVLDSSYSIDQLPHWNGGVFFFVKNDRVERFFDIWYFYYQKHQIRFDQVSLVEAVFRSDAKMLSLDYRWNGKLRPNSKKSADVIIHHYVTDQTKLSNPVIETRIIEDALAYADRLPIGPESSNRVQLEQFFRRINEPRENYRANKKKPLKNRIGRRITRFIKGSD